MGHRQRHRGRHPDDDHLFHASQLSVLRAAVADLSYLLGRGYADKAALKVVGDHYQLAERQRRAVSGAACSPDAVAGRQRREIPLDALAGERVAVDGYNLLIITESLLSDGVLIRGRDGCIRDLASVHGSYHRVEETMEAIDRLGEVFASLAVGDVHWHFDAPVSNSGRLASILREQAATHGWPWRVTVRGQVDQCLADSEAVVVTSDSWILDRAQRWANVKARVVRRAGLWGELIDLG